MMKALLALLGGVLLLFGLNETQSDPVLRQLQTVGIAELEQGKSIPQDQFLAVNDAYWMPYYMVSYSHSRKRGDEAHVFVPLGSLEMQKKAFDRQAVKPVLWVRLERDFKTKEIADAAMQEDAPYLKPYPVSGVVRELETSVREEMGKEGRLQIDRPLAMHAGSTPMSLGDAAGMALAGGLVLALVVLWTVSDLSAAKWLRSLAGPGVEVFAGRGGWAAAAMVAAPFFVVLGGLAMAGWTDDRSLPMGLIGLALLSLGIVAWALWRSRAAVLLGADRLEIVRNSQRSSVALADVTALVVDERKVKGVKVCKYTLLGPAKPVEVGSGLLKGALDDAAAFGASLRERLLQRLGPALAERVQRGEQVSFGPLSVSAQGLSKGKSGSGEVLSWAELQSAILKNGQLKIKQKGKMFGWGSFAAKKVHNIDVLMSIFQSRGV